MLEMLEWMNSKQKYAVGGVGCHRKKEKVHDHI